MTIDLRTRRYRSLRRPPARTCASTSVNVAFTATDTNLTSVELQRGLRGLQPLHQSALVLTSLSQGVHTVVVRATDAAGRTTSASRSASLWTRSCRRYRSPHRQPGSTSTQRACRSASARPTRTSRASPASLTPQQRLPARVRRVFTSLAQGDHTVVVAATDQAGNVGQASVSFRVDTIQPVVAVSFPTAGAHVASTSVAVAFSATDASPLTFECNVDGAGFSTCSSPLNLTSLTQGAHSVVIRATDPASNTQSVTRNFIVDTVAPAVSITSPTAGQYFNSTSASVSFSATDANLASVTCQLDTGSATACTSPRNYASLSQGEHTVIVAATDQAGNASQASVSFRVDTIQPIVAVSFPAAGAHVASTSVAVAFTASDASPLTVECDVDGAGFSTCSSPLSLTSLTQGGHTVVVRATDPAGNVHSITRSFTVDTVAPSVSITSPTADQYFNTTSVSVGFSASDSNLASVVCQLDAGPATACTSPRSYSSLAQGDHTVVVAASDQAGNVALANVTFHVDTIAPAVSITAPTASRSSTRPASRWHSPRPTQRGRSIAASTPPLRGMYESAESLRAFAGSSLRDRPRNGPGWQRDQ